MADFLSVRVSGNQALIDQLAQAVKRLDDTSELLNMLGGTLAENIERRFARKQDPSGASWAPLAESTKARYAREDTNGLGETARRGTLLERTGQMINSLNVVVGDDQVEVGMNRLTPGGTWALPLLHEFGTRRMPRRGIFFADPEAGTLAPGDEADLAEDIAAYLDSVFGA